MEDFPAPVRPTTPTLTAGQGTERKGFKGSIHALEGLYTHAHTHTHAQTETHTTTTTEKKHHNGRAKGETGRQSTGTNPGLPMDSEGNVLEDIW